LGVEVSEFPQEISIKYTVVLDILEINGDVLGLTRDICRILNVGKLPALAVKYVHHLLGHPHEREHNRVLLREGALVDVAFELLLPVVIHLLALLEQLLEVLFKLRVLSQEGVVFE
jgi:hypothetical protein